MHEVDGHYTCALCGAVLDVPADTMPKIVIASSDGQPNYRIIQVDGEEIHRCESGLNR